VFDGGRDQAAGVDNDGRPFELFPFVEAQSGHDGTREPGEDKGESDPADVGVGFGLFYRVVEFIENDEID
jgi:hypothetical protein